MAKPKVTFKMADGTDPEKRFKELTPINITASAAGIAEIMNQIGITSITDFMINAGDIASAKLAVIHPTKLTIRIGRLSRSILNAFSFSIAKLPLVKNLGDRFVKGRTKTKFANGQKEGFRKIFYDKSLRRVNGEMGTKVPYAAVHEFGGRVHPKRAFLFPAVEKVRPRMAGIIDKELGKAYRIKGWK